MEPQPQCQICVIVTIGFVIWVEEWNREFYNFFSLLRILDFLFSWVRRVEF